MWPFTVIQRNGSQNSITDAIRKYFDEVKPKYQKTLKSKEHADFVAANDMGRERMNLLGLLISDLLSKNSSQPEEELSI
ncbi:hypothetical protein AB6A40_001442 [Gnathostoma spinigerum]|uniref:Uncharacterized protein n=1 Tax=Gnathostoma spinigerum TaxID=75299 RepID=A0ABD6E4C5_9BILA